MFLHRRLSSREPLLHAPAWEDRTDVVAGLILLECGWRRNETLTRTHVMDFTQAYIGVIQLKPIGKAQSLINDLVAVNECQRRDGLRSQGIADERSNATFREGHHQRVHPIGFG